MTCSSSLADDLTPLVLDTSVLINLHASSFGEQIVAAIPNVIVVPDIVVRELENDARQISDEHQFLKNLIVRQLVQPVSLDDAGWRIFEKLTTAVPSLGDGEAATIAVAATRGFRPVIDDAKGRKSAEALVGDSAVAWSLDLLVHPHVQRELPSGRYVEAVFLALRAGRMRISAERSDAVVKLIGVGRASSCTSLPGFRKRKEIWQRELKVQMEQ